MSRRLLSMAYNAKETGLPEAMMKMGSVVTSPSCHSIVTL